MRWKLAAAAAMMFTATFAARAEMAAPPDHPALLEEITFLDIRDGGANYRLEALIVRPAAAKGKLPIALLTHGKPRLPSDLVKIRAELMSRQARDLAYRGYLAVAVVRRGLAFRAERQVGRPTRTSSNATTPTCASISRWNPTISSAPCASSPRATMRTHRG